MAPLLFVLARIVCTALICVSYSLRPDLTGSIVNDDTSCLPADITELVILERAVIATTWSAENFTLIASAPCPIGFKSTLLAARPTSLRPSLVPLKFSFFLSLSKVDILSAAFFSKFRLSNCISTTLVSTTFLLTY